MSLHREPIQHPAEVVSENPVEAAVRETLYDSEPLRQSKATIEVAAADGVVTLTGNVRTRTHIDFATTLARRAAGGREVRSRLIADTDIENEVALALATDPRTKLTTDRVGVTALLGSIMLTGTVDSPDQKAAAVEMVRGVPGVWEVVDGLAVSVPSPSGRGVG